jgi:uncharacterized tellurite resistance protein B-like protein
LALLLARDPHRTAASLWGTLSWVKPAGDAAAIAVFLEQLPVVQEAALLVEDCAIGSSNRWSSARALGDLLETEGVLMAPGRWDEMIDDVLKTKQAPKLVPLPELRTLADTERAKRLAENLRIASADPSPDKTLTDRDRAAITVAANVEMLVDLGMHVASADGDVAQSELDALRDCVFRLADSDDRGLVAEIERACRRSAAERSTVRKLGEQLRDVLSLKQRLATVDMTFAIANATRRSSVASAPGAMTPPATAATTCSTTTRSWTSRASAAPGCGSRSARWS